MLATTSPFPQFFDADGSPLDDGELFYGSANLNPENNPLIVYWDAAGTQPAAQPVKVMNGYPVRGGTPANIFSALDYSLTVRDRKGRIVYYSPSSVSYSNDLALQQQIAQAVSDLKTLYADPASALNGAGAVGYGSDIAYMAGTIGAKARETKSIFDFMSNAQLQDVMTNTCALDLASVFTAARAWAAGLGRPAAIVFPGFRYKASAFPNWDIKDLALVSIGTPEWICTGGGPIMRRDGSAGFIYGQFIGDFILTGNPGCSVGYLATKTTHSVVGQIRVREVSGTSHQIQLGVLEYYRQVECSINSDPGMVTIPARGLQLGAFGGLSTTACIFANAIMEGPVQGFDLVAADNILFLAGTGEACTVRGGNTAAVCKGITLQNMSCEANGTEDWLNFGRMTGFIGGYYGKLINHIGARLFVIDRALLQSVTSDAASSGEIRDCEYSNFSAGGSITPAAGARVTLRSNWNVNLAALSNFSCREWTNPVQTFAAITPPASGTAYQNTSAYAERISFIQTGGTVTAIEIADTANAFTTVGGGATGGPVGGVFWLFPGEKFRPTYSGSVQMTRLPA